MFLLPNACFTLFIHRNIGLPLGLLIHLRLHHQSLIIHLHHVTEPSQNTFIYSVFKLCYHPLSISNNVSIDPVPQSDSYHAPDISSQKTFNILIVCTRPRSLSSLKHCWDYNTLIQPCPCFQLQRPTAHYII